MSHEDGYVILKDEVPVEEKKASTGSSIVSYSKFAWLNTLRLNLIRIRRMFNVVDKPFDFPKAWPSLAVVLPILALVMYGSRLLIDSYHAFIAPAFNVKPDTTYWKRVKEALTEERKGRMFNDLYWIPVTALATALGPIGSFISAGAYVIDIAQDYLYKDKQKIAGKKADLTEAEKIPQLGAYCTELREEISTRQTRRKITHAINIGLAIGMGILCIPGGQIVGAAIVLGIGILGIGFRIWDKLIKPVKETKSFVEAQKEVGIDSKIVPESKLTPSHSPGPILTRTHRTYATRIPVAKPMERSLTFSAKSSPHRAHSVFKSPSFSVESTPKPQKGFRNK